MSTNGLSIHFSHSHGAHHLQVSQAVCRLQAPEARSSGGKELNYWPCHDVPAQGLFFHYYFTLFFTVASKHNKSTPTDADMSFSRQHVGNRQEWGWMNMLLNKEGVPGHKSCQGMVHERHPVVPDYERTRSQGFAELPAPPLSSVPAS